VKFINTEGMAFIGPGSEWFWTAISGLVLAVTFIAIYRQLRLQASASAIEQMNTFEHEWYSERYLHYKLDILVGLRDGTNPADVPWAAANSVCNFWERVASLTRSGHLNRELLASSIGAGCPTNWMRLAPFVRKTREQERNSTAYEHFEWLAGAMAEIVLRDGGTIDDALIASWLNDDITACMDRIHVEQALRTVIVAPAESVTVGQPLAPTPATPAEAPAGQPA
jgi:hypothetical protein